MDKETKKEGSRRDGIPLSAVDQATARELMDVINKYTELEKLAEIGESSSQLTAEKITETLEQAKKILQSLIEKTQPKSYTAPSSSELDTMMTAMYGGKREADTIAARQERINPNKRWSTEVDEHNRYIITTKRTYKDKDGENYTETVKISFSDIDKMTQRRSEPLSNVFIFMLSEIDKQCISAGKIRGSTARFNISELVDAGIYKSEIGAIDGFERYADIFSDIKVKVRRQKEGSKTPKSFTICNIFDSISYNSGRVTIKLRSLNVWREIVKNYIEYPREYMLLRGPAEELMRHLLYIEPQRKKQIEECGYYTISLKTIQMWLFLPVKSNKFKEDVVDVIQQAVDEINSTSSRWILELSPMSENQTAKQYIDNPQNKLKIRVNRDLQKSLFIS